ncbi:MAG: hypothetical protein K1X85_02005 [Ignavibacteria bacterium]|nr:hypothetical protein [Ignavibacteria bacterium]
MDISFRSEYGFILAAVAVIVSAAAAYFYYRGSAAEGGLKKILTGLRFLSIFFIVLLLLSPVLSFVGITDKKPTGIILIDNSSSVRELNGKDMKELIEKARLASGGGEVRTFVFSDGITGELSGKSAEQITSDSSSAGKTNLSKAFQDLKLMLPDENISSVTVISDGILNEGGNPLQSALRVGSPVNFILAGDTGKSRDISLTDVLYGKNAFIESSVPVSAVISSNGFEGTLNIRLTEDGKLIDSRTVNIIQGRTKYNADFTVSSPVTRTAHYRIEIDSVEGEKTLKNNSADFFIRFTDNRFKMLVISGGPSSDLAFIKEQVSRIKNFDAEFRTQKSPSEFYEGSFPDLAVFDVIMLAGFPTSATDEGALNAVKVAAERTGKPIIFFGSRNTDYGRLKALEDRLPFIAENYSDQESETKLEALSGTGQTAYRDVEMLSKAARLPGIFITGTAFSAKPDAQTILVASGGNRPALLISAANDRRSAAFLPYGIYKWRLGGNAAEAEEFLGYIVSTAASAVVRKDAGKKFNVETVRPVFPVGGKAEFTGAITGLEIKGGEKITLRIKGPEQTKELEMVRVSDNKFQLSDPVTSPGVYEYEAELISEGRGVEKITGKFLAGEDNFEYLETQPDPSVMNELANSTGGRRLDVMSNDEITATAGSNRTTNQSGQLTSKSFDLNINPYYLGLVILLLCTEWFLRKRNNMP